MVLESHVKLCVEKPDFPGKNLFINIYQIWSKMKIYISCCVPAKMLHLENFLFLRYGQKCSEPIRLQNFLINHISRSNQWIFFCMLIQIHIQLNLIKIFLAGRGQKWMWPVWLQIEKTDFLNTDANPGKLKVASMIFG